LSLVAVPADKRFRRAHVRPARPRRVLRGWRARAVRAVVSVVAAYAAYRGAIAVAHTRVLQIDRIVVQGNTRVSTGEVLAVLNGLRGQSLIRTDLNAWRRSLLASPWIRDVDMRRSLPSTVDVVVSERQPLGIGRIKGQLYLIDERGVLIDEYGPQYAEFDLPIIDGLPEPGQEEAIDGARVDLAARLLAAVKPQPEIARLVSQIDVRNVRNATVILTGDPAAIQLGDQQFLRRLQSYSELAPTLRARVPDIDAVDMRFDGRIYVRPAAKSGRASARGQAAAR
jgi:cell division septal protein FtsQ